ncbi:MAG: hypothetical protein ACTSUE_21150 [Promethearchaeota archaeon]
MALEDDLKNKIDDLRISIENLKKMKPEVSYTKLRPTFDTIRTIEREIRKVAKSKPVIISFRLKNEEEKEKLFTIAKNDGLSVTDFIKKRLFKEVPVQGTGTGEKERKDLIESLNFLFKFFDKNAENLEITTAEMERIKSIYQFYRGLAE